MIKKKVSTTSRVIKFSSASIFLSKHKKLHYCFIFSPISCNLKSVHRYRQYRPCKIYNEYYYHILTAKDLDTSYTCVYLYFHIKNKTSRAGQMTTRQGHSCRPLGSCSIMCTPVIYSISPLVYLFKWSFTQRSSK